MPHNLPENEGQNFNEIFDREFQEAVGSQTVIPPKGFKAELYPLRHQFNYAFGLGQPTASGINSTICTIAKNYKTQNLADTIVVNPHNAGFETETGAICSSMSILDKIKISINFTLTEDAILEGLKAIKIQYMPIFTIFPEKLDSADDKTTTTAAAVLELTKDATEEDITPAFGTKLVTGSGGSSFTHPVSSANITETKEILNLSTDLVMEAVPWDNVIFFRALKYYTNKGAIQSMIGKMRTLTLTSNRPNQRVFFRKFVPRAVRRIMPYSYFGMLFHLPTADDPSQYFNSGAVTSLPHIGVKMLVSYDEWHVDHNQDMATT